MEIRFDAVSLTHSFSAQNGGKPDPKPDPTECVDEYYSKGFVCSLMPGMPEDEQGVEIDLRTFQHTPDLYRQACGQGYSVVCNPTGMGRIAVVDEAAAELLERFRVPASLADLGMEGEAYAEARAAVAFFFQVGFLEDVARPSFISRQTMSRTLNAWLHVTNACNLRCDYCYVEKTAEAMSDEIARRAVEAIFRSALKHGFEAVQLRYAGGEASLLGERVLALHDYALALARRHRIALHASLLSNGVFLTRRTIEGLKQREIGVMISLDGIGSFHDRQRPLRNGGGSFAFVERTIGQLLAMQLVPHISVTVSQRNLAGLPELIAYILQRDLPFSLNYYRENDCSAHLADLQLSEREMIETMRAVFALIERDLPQRNLLGSLIDKANLQYPHARSCGVGRNYLVIDQRGGIAKCHADIKKTVATIAADDPLALVRNDRRGVQGYDVAEKEGCRSCLWRNWCGGGCPLLTYRATGRSDVKSPNCHIYQALFPDVLRLEALRLLKYVPAYPLLSAQPDIERPRAELFARSLPERLLQETAFFA